MAVNNRDNGDEPAVLAEDNRGDGDWPEPGTPWGYPLRGCNDEGSSDAAMSTDEAAQLSLRCHR